MLEIMGPAWTMPGGMGKNYGVEDLVRVSRWLDLMYNHLHVYLGISPIKVRDLPQSNQV